MKVSEHEQEHEQEHEHENKHEIEQLNNIDMDVAQTQKCLWTWTGTRIGTWTWKSTSTMGLDMKKFCKDHLKIL